MHIKSLLLISKHDQDYDRKNENTFCNDEKNAANLYSMIQKVKNIPVLEALLGHHGNHCKAEVVFALGK